MFPVCRAAAALALVVASTVALSITAIGAAQPAKSDPPAKPDCIVSDVRETAPATAVPRPPSTLPVDTRRAIFIELQQTVVRAQRDAATAYPTAENGTMMSPTNVQKDTKLSKKRDAASVSLERSYLAAVLKERALTCDAAREIVREGRAAHWPASAKQ